MTMQIDAYCFALVWVDVVGWLGRERPADSLLLGLFSKRSNCCFNTNFNFKQTLYFMKVFILLVK